MTKSAYVNKATVIIKCNLTVENCRGFSQCWATLIEEQIKLQTGKCKVTHTEKNDPNFFFLDTVTVF